MIWEKLRYKVIEHVIATLAIAIFGGIAAGALAAWLGVKEWIDFDIPSGAVMAFWAPCPTGKGWTDFPQASGRFIVGANPDRRWGLSERPFKEAGGGETVALDAKNLPPHTHGGKTIDVSMTWKTANADCCGSGATRNAAVVKDAQASTYPGIINALPHDHNIKTDNGDGLVAERFKIDPPYVSLNYCIKS